LGNEEFVGKSSDVQRMTNDGFSNDEGMTKSEWRGRPMGASSFGH